MIGSAKVTRWDGMQPLPIQKLFGIDCRKLPGCESGAGIWHVGRFAVSQSLNTSGIMLLKRLIALVIRPICESENGVMVAECDAKFVKGLRMLGIQTRALAKGITYLGSETIPIYATREWLQVFLDKNEHILSADIFDMQDFPFAVKSIA